VFVIILRFGLSYLPKAGDSPRSPAADCHRPRAGIWLSKRKTLRDTSSTRPVVKVLQGRAFAYN